MIETRKECVYIGFDYMLFGENVVKVAKITKISRLKENFMLRSDTTNCKNVSVSKFSFCVNSLSL
jgi:hypothetical protein